MNWVQIMTNLLTAVIASLIAQHTIPETWVATLGPILAVLAGLFQPQPHKN